MMPCTMPYECAQIWTYAPKSNKKAKKNDESDDDEEDIEAVEVNYVYVHTYICV